jgi:large conductance mechanosensitive channel
MIDQTRTVWGDFRTFLLKENIIALAIAVVVGTALNGVVKSLVDDVIMPVVAFATPQGDWRSYKLHLGPVALGIGSLAAALLNFVIVGLVAWRIAKAFIRPEPPPPAGPPMQDCRFCRMTIARDATRCPHCTSVLAETASLPSPGSAVRA